MISPNIGPVLITGHTGFKGIWLTLLLEAMGIEVVGVSLEPDEICLYSQLKRHGSIPEVFADIRDKRSISNFLSMTKPTTVIHLAARAILLDSFEQPLETFSINSIGTANLLDCCFKNASIKSIVVATTDKVYRVQENQVSHSESSPLGGSDPYSASKVATEAAVMTWQSISSHLGGPKIGAARAGNVIGGGDLAQNRLIPDLIRGITNGTTVTIRNPESDRPWQHVLDPLIGYLEYASKLSFSDTEKAMNFGPSGENLKVINVVERLKNSWPNNLAIRIINDKSMRETKSLSINSALALRELNWTPTWNQDAAVKSTIDWWKSVLTKELSPKEACTRDINKVMEKFRGD